MKKIVPDLKGLEVEEAIKKLEEIGIEYEDEIDGLINAAINALNNIKY